MSQYPAGRSTQRGCEWEFQARSPQARQQQELPDPDTGPPANQVLLMSSKVPAAFRCISLALALAFSLNAASQTANLSGAVRDSSQAVVVGASISIARESTGLKQTTSSSEQGFYFFAFLLPGLYTITAEAPGFGVVSRSSVKLDPGQEARLDFTLVPATVKEKVTVQGSSSSLQTESAALGTEIDPQFVQNL